MCQWLYGLRLLGLVQINEFIDYGIRVKYRLDQGTIQIDIDQGIRVNVNRYRLDQGIRVNVNRYRLEQIRVLELMQMDIDQIRLGYQG